MSISIESTGIVVTSNGDTRYIPFTELHQSHEALKYATHSELWYIGYTVGYKDAECVKRRE